MNESPPIADSETTAEHPRWDDLNSISDPLTPESRAEHPGITGVPVKLGDGLTWLMPRGGLDSRLDEVRDRLYEEGMYSGMVSSEVVTATAEFLLLQNYRFTKREIIILVGSADRTAIIDAVIEAVLPTQEVNGVGYTAWAESGLRSVGIDPGSVPADSLPNVLRHLVLSGRIVSAEEFTDVGIAMSRRAGLPVPKVSPATPE